MKKVKLFLMLFLLCVGVLTTYSQSDAINPPPGVVGMNMLGDSCSGPGAQRFDGFLHANGYGWNTTVTDGRIVMKFRPASYPWKYTKLCMGMTRNAGSDSLMFDIVIYDTTGAAGAPGAVIGTLTNQVARVIPTFPLYSWYNFDISSISPTINTGAVYIGVKWNASVVNSNGKFFMADENAATPLWPGYSWSNAGPWNQIQLGGFPNYKAMAFRTEGSSGPPAGTLYSRCKSVNLPIPDNSNAGVTDTFVVAGLPTTALITRVQVRMDSVIHTWVGDLVITVNKGATTVTLCRNSGAGLNGSSGDNFIGTTFSDTARYNIDSILTTTGQGQLSAPYTGYFRTNSNPPNTPITSTPLSLFNGVSNPNGVWTFSWKDSALQDLGTVRRYCVMIDYVDYTGITQTGTEIPNKYFVNQNYPNPFNPVTNIKFGLPNAGNVKLVVFDILGREVATLVNEFKAAGQYTADFDASMLSSGAYFYRIEAGDFVETKKMLLVK